MKAWVMVVVVLIVILGIGGAIWMATSGNGRDGLRLGVLFPLSGDAASYGEKGRRAIELALSEARLHSTLPIRIIYEDSRAEPAVGGTAMQKLANVDQVHVVIGDIVSAVTLAAAPIAERNKIVLLSPTSSAPAITSAGPFVYRIWPSDLMEGRILAEWAAERNYGSAAILHLQNDYGIAIADVFASTFEKLGGDVVVRHAYSADQTDFRTMLTSVRQARPDVVYIAGYYADSAAMLRQARELRVASQFLGTTAIEDPQFLALAGDAAEGVVYPLASGFDSNSSDPRVQAFVSSFRARYGETPGWVEAHAYDAFKLIAEAAIHCKEDLSGPCLKSRLDSMGVYEGVTGAIEFDENGDVTKPVRMRTVQEGQFVDLQE